jgi:hypothetical protein
MALGSNRRTVVSSRAATLGLALLCVLALAFAAATLPDPNASPGAAGNGSDDAGLIPDREPPEPANFLVDIPQIVRDVVLAALIVGLLAAVVVLVYDPYETLSMVAKVVLIAAAVIAVMAVLAYILQLLTGDVASGGGGPGLESGETGGGLGGGGGGIPTADLLVAIGGVAAVLLVAIVVTYLYGDRRRIGGPRSALEGIGTSGRGVPSAIGRVAGRAADRIERDVGAPVENEVFRAWREMTERLDAPSPRSSTPGEFAQAAIEAGLDPADVSELTDLFREVRYGGADPTSEREERAAAVLRRIEREYAGDDD